MDVEQLKGKKLTRLDIAQLLASLGEPGENREQKIETIKQLNLSNFQQVPLEETLDSYQEF